MKFCYKQLTALMLLLCGVEGHRNGAPKEACKSMFPSGHGVAAQASTPPYTLEAEVKSKDGITDKVKVTIQVPKQQNYGSAMRGFFLQMRDANTNEALGKWDNNEINWAKGLDCNDEAGFDALTHANNDPKRESPVFKWTMPEGFKGTVSVYAQATVVESREKFWTGIKSKIMTLNFGTVSEHNYDDNEATSEANYEAIFEETSSKAAATQVGLPVVAMFAITFATILL